MSWESSAVYYRLLNQLAREKLGGQHSARILMASVDFHEVVEAQHDGDWARGAAIVADAARQLERGGADFALLCTNTMHKILPEVQRQVALPFIHIADATGARLRTAGMARVALLATRFTMEQAFYREHLAQQFGLDVRVPEQAERDMIHRVIYDELCRGEIRDDSRAQYVAVVERMKREGAQAVILGCTEITLLIDPADVSIPTFDTTGIHCEAALQRALA